MTITLTPEVEARLHEEAARQGQEANAFAVALLSAGLEEARRSWAEEVTAIQEGLDAVREGRERPFEEFLAEHRSRYSAANK